MAMNLSSVQRRRSCQHVSTSQANPLRVLLSMVLFLAAVMMTQAATAQSWICDRTPYTRSISVVFPKGGALPCQVIYDKSSEGLGVTTPWLATGQAGFCTEKAEALIARHTQWGWSCSATSPTESTDSPIAADTSNEPASNEETEPTPEPATLSKPEMETESSVAQGSLVTETPVTETPVTETPVTETSATVKSAEDAGDIVEPIPVATTANPDLKISDTAEPNVSTTAPDSQTNVITPTDSLDSGESDNTPVTVVTDKSEQAENTSTLSTPIVATPAPAVNATSQQLAQTESTTGAVSTSAVSDAATTDSTRAEPATPDHEQVADTTSTLEQSSQDDAQSTAVATLSPDLTTSETPQQPSPTSKQITRQMRKHITNFVYDVKFYLWKNADGAYPGDVFSETPVTGDVNQDGKEDFAFLYTIENRGGRSAANQYLHVFLNDGSNGYNPASTALYSVGAVPDKSLVIQHIENGKIFLAGDNQSPRVIQLLNQQLIELETPGN